MGKTDPAVHQKDWTNIAFLTLTPIVALVGTTLYTWRAGFEWWMAALFVGMYLLVGISICAGYHRLFSHKSYECSPLVQYFYAFFGAMAAQNSVLWWSSSHRVHHRYVDQDWDPYNIRRGFWWAHIFWIFYKNPDHANFDNAKDLERNPVVQWQHRWHKHILIVGGFGIPTLIGYLMGDAVAGLLWGGFLRVFVIHHTTFFVNSLAHNWGERTFSAEVSARDNWMVALVTLGEGYHSFHHRFPSDFRNGIRWYQWDPAKWFIATLRLAGLASRLKATASPVIEEAVMQAAVKKLEARIENAPSTHVVEIERKIDRARKALEQSFTLWRRHAQERADGLSERWRATRRRSKLHLKVARKEWRSAVRMVAEMPDAA